ncbi:hypothetical protein AA15237_0671 [Komagataeibacter xylinus NBRC 15237]|nr:hypothetical protein AA15237_0671 [Komagataeibacter xylinus NBRC 15237]
MKAYIHYAIVCEKCPVCSQGQVLVARDNDTNSFCFICDECMSEWDNLSGIQDVGKGTMFEHENVTFMEVKQMATHKLYKYVLNKG